MVDRGVTRTRAANDGEPREPSLESLDEKYLTPQEARDFKALLAFEKKNPQLGALEDKALVDINDNARGEMETRHNVEEGGTVGEGGRITFASGSISVTIHGTLDGPAPHAYTLRLLQGQSVRLKTEGAVYLPRLYEQGTDTPLEMERVSHVEEVSHSLPETGDLGFSLAVVVCGFILLLLQVWVATTTIA